MVNEITNINKDLAIAVEELLLKQKENNMQEQSNEEPTPKTREESMKAHPSNYKKNT